VVEGRVILDVDALDARIREIARDAIRSELGERGDDWVSQHRSPLGREMHCRLVRDGKLPGVRVHRRVLVRRRDLDAYIESHRAAPPVANDVGSSPEARALARVGARRVAP
jgi:excisionase family DNA binding protein